MATDEHQTAPIATLAAGFAEYLSVQTDSNIAPPETVTQDSLHDALESLDVALNQLMDFAGIYGSDPRLDIEPLALPAAALCGEYLRHGAGAVWEPIKDEGDDTLIMNLDDDRQIDLLNSVRGSLFSGMSNLSTMVSDLLADGGRRS